MTELTAFGRHAVGRDAVTGLSGRDSVRARLSEWLARGEPVHALLLGLRRFDAVNLAFGRAVGDAALAEVTARIRHFAADALDGSWLSTRISGGQFLLIASESCSRERWQFLASGLLDVVARPMPVAGATIRLSPRAALLRGLSGESADLALDRLGQALTRLMENPGRRLAWVDGEAARTGRSAAQLEADLLAAIDRDEIEIVFQPQFACVDDRLIGAEALARWNHPQLGRIGAVTLFSVAERADQVAHLSRHIARLALGQVSAWPSGLRLSLNVTPGELVAPEYAEELLSLVAASGFRADRLTIEVTEQVLVSELGLAAESFRALHRRGVRIALDDFGAGFCNFRYLKLLPLDYLKLDRSMIDGIGSDPRDLAVLRGILAMARALGLKVIAEGIEDPAQLALVRSEGCDSYQGYIKAQPMPAGDFLTLARS